MNKNEFFNILMDQLKDIPEKKLQNIIFHYENLFDLERQNGKSEEEIIKGLGDINTLIDKYKNETFSEDSIEIYSNKPLQINTHTDNNIIPNENNASINENLYTNTNINNTNENKNGNNSTSCKISNTTKSININSILKICILILSIIIFAPIFTTIVGIIAGAFGASIGIFFGSIGLLIGGTFTNLSLIPDVPAFISNFPYPALVLFCLGTITLSIILLILFYYVAKASLIGIKKLYSILMS